MNVVIVGYGRMGKLIEQNLKSRNHSIAGIVDPGLGSTWADISKEADAAIEFSVGEAVMENAKEYARRGIAAVVASTAWEDIREDVKDIVLSSGNAMMWGNNFSIGSHIFFHLIEQASRILNKTPGYDAFLHETHHRFKIDAPSGTAITAAQRFIDASNQKDSVVKGNVQRALQDNEFHISSSRGGNIPGIHSLILDSSFDTIELSHSARSREGFAQGAVMAMEWLSDKKGFYSVEEYISLLIGDLR
jgi:4-hydroxy-tetrahydrodipicolinate reductase